MRRFTILLVALLFAVPLLGFAPGQPKPMPVDPNKAGFAHPPIHVHGRPTPSSPTGFTPNQIKTAYGFSRLSATGSGQTVAVVDAYGSPTIQKDLNQFCNQFGLASTTVQINYPSGKPPKSDAGWALETSLDVEWVHALAPGATIVLEVARSSSLNDLLAAVDDAVKHQANVVSMSWGGKEFSGETNYDFHFNKTGIVFTASSGDNGSGVSWPAASPYVVGVGGTTLYLKSDDSYGSETAWSGSGGGVSAVELVPSYQPASQIWRGVPDVAFDADPNTGVAIYDSTKYFGQSGWFQVGGTSFGSPAWAALFALADQSRSSSLTGADAALYGAGGSNYHDITTGSNGAYSATGGYDFVTGIGSPQVNNLVPVLVSAP